MSELKSSAQWSMLIYGKDYPDFLLDPDGWDRKNFEESWNEPITIEEYQRRFLFSTVMDVQKTDAIEDFIRKQKRTYFKLSPELGDDEHWTPVTDTASVLEAVKLWCEEFGRVVGDSCEIEIIEMTEEEFDALPEI